MTIRPAIVAAAITTLAFLGTTASATVYNRSPTSNWQSFLTNPSFLQPGDELVLTGGVYSTFSRLSVGNIGTAENPIIIRAAEGASVTLTRPNAGQNVLNIEGAQHVKIQGIEITGGSAGIRIGDRNGTQAKFITLDGNHIHHTGNAAVTANYNGRTYEGMHFLNNHIHNTGQEGEGFYLGCNNNDCQFYDGIIEKNYIHDLKGGTISQGDGIELKYGSYNNIVRDNIIHDTNYPGIIAYGVAGNGGPGARNTFERNVIWNSGDNAIQVAADANIRNNLIFSSSVDGIHSQNHQGAVPGNLTITNNTIRTSGNAIDIGFPSGGALSGPIVIANNALYPGGSFAIDSFVTNGITSTGNVGTGAASGLPFDASGNLNSDFIDFLNKNAFPALGSKLIGTGDAGLQAADDFNTTDRTGSNDVGAYLYDASGNPGWAVTSAFKEFPSVVGLPGDFDGDNDVDGADFLVWQRDTTGKSLSDWQSNFGTVGSAAAATGAVPEPSSLLLLAIGSLAMSCRNRQK